jgi:DNA-binding response OmpR family regulator
MSWYASDGFREIGSSAGFKGLDPSTHRDLAKNVLVRQLANRGITFPVIFMTGSDNEEIAMRARDAGCVAFFRKPFFSAYLLIEALNGLPNSYAAIRPRPQRGG